MLTNLIATIVFTVTTNNWMTTHTVHPAGDSGTAVLAVYRPVIAHQVGAVMSNTIAQVRWNGRTNAVVLESVLIGSAERDVDAFKELEWRSWP